MSADNPEMNAGDVIELVQLLNQNGIEVIIDGGWGVDALLGEQTRPHSDLDVAVEHKDVPRIRSLLEALGYTDVPRDDTRDCNFVLGDQDGHLFDIHSFTFDSMGKITFGVAYPFESLKGSGAINGHPVRCITPEWMVRFHTSYPLDEDDYHDVKLLCRKYGIEIPQEYRVFLERDHQLNAT
jgi:lincosamide nucleotidyltransferase A/C/D/E